MHYTTLDFADDAAEDKLAELLTQLDAERGTLGQPGLLLRGAAERDRDARRGRSAARRGAEGWVRLIIEKPFGHDLASAQELNAEIKQHFTEDEVFRIDHYLGKETVQNMLALRFANGIFEPIWNRQFIDHVQITVAESIGIEGARRLLRAGGRDPRHLPEPPAAARRDHGDGAADRLHRRLGAQREGEGAEVDAHAGPEARRARAVRPGLRRGRGGARLPRGGRASRPAR